ncbi:heme ABC exporter, ATP-binding protein CcmA [Clostridium argentinense CDC 2741]|uniref:Heme ABC exporter, ATP-binding protein CcmA n=1 Tax=Clostridium argentinense CDC 2741 TaxID=1418104 RepID=A0A0C1UGP9_9CLOT|nr:ABC-F type ribosomal protection protein [Clostridium argentinense]ARC86543.1 multidrug ABC transporter ATP-binding protein [Clostridium argentinense]KIE46565.1 heme ABC exporter, ATP-binding protein CcmA [Clostridium argentinense CDC 2741]NFF38006.1 ABC-F type ribosomal protection protein [Clostridium argentinense]NFP49988.1 ABC-F type ribosomal protection protein [Clostridium argentinense]NFP71398.1 ABC-F type ribosomal protection protein [Clostridium argentinense]
MLVQLNNVGKSFNGEILISNINLKVEESEKIGLIGVNGAGKSTLLKMIYGDLSHDEGEIIKSREKTFAYLKQDSGLNLENSIKEEMLSVFNELLNVERELRELEKLMSSQEIIEDYEKLEKIMKKYSSKTDYFVMQGGYEIEAKINTILNGIGFKNFDLNIKVSKLSGGQKTKLSLAKILLNEPDLLMLDEPTNHLDLEALNWLEGYLKSYKGAVLIVSHDRYFLDSTVSVIYEIERGKSKRYTGNYSKYVSLKAEEKELHIKNYERQQEEIKRLQTFVDKNIVRATSAKAAKSKRKAIERMEKIDVPLGDLKKVNMNFEIKSKSYKEVLQFKEGIVSVGEGENKKILTEDLNFDLTRGDRVALIGPNGVGKTSLLKVLIGDLQLEHGSINWGKDVQIGYYDQEHEKLNPNNTILEEVWDDFPTMKESKIRGVLGRFLFSGEDIFKKIGDLSGGEKSRVALSKLMLIEANLLLLDEPTNHLDLQSKEVLESALKDYEGTILFISHDRYFINKIGNKVMELTKEGVKCIKGNYDDYLLEASSKK